MTYKSEFYGQGIRPLIIVEKGGVRAAAVRMDDGRLESFPMVEVNAIETVMEELAGLPLDERPDVNLYIGSVSELLKTGVRDSLARFRGENSLELQDVSQMWMRAVTELDSAEVDAGDIERAREERVEAGKRKLSAEMLQKLDEVLDLVELDRAIEGKPTPRVVSEENPNWGLF